MPSNVAGLRQSFSACAVPSRCWKYQFLKKRVPFDTSGAARARGDFRELIFCEDRCQHRRSRSMDCLGPKILDMRGPSLDLLDEEARDSKRLQALFGIQSLNSCDISQFCLPI